MNKVIKFPSSIKSLGSYWMVANFQGVEVVAQGSTEEECREQFEQELAYAQSLINSSIDIAI